MEPERQEYGIDRHYTDQIRGVFASFPKITRVYLYGSRARGDFRPDSDIDLAVTAPKMEFKDFLLLRSRLDDLPLVFKIDLVHLDTLDKQDLSRKIKEESVLFYERKP